MISQAEVSKSHSDRELLVTSQSVPPQHRAGNNQPLRFLLAHFQRDEVYLRENPFRGKERLPEDLTASLALPLESSRSSAVIVPWTFRLARQPDTPLACGE